jgi:hypothetical protein
VKRYWELVADKLSKAGWTWGCVATVDAHGRTIFVADAHRGDGKRFVVRAEEKLTAFSGTRISDARLTAVQHRSVPLIEREIVRSNYAATSARACAGSSKSASRAGPRCSTQRAGIASPHAEGDGLSGATFDGETFAFICGPAGVVGGVPLTRAMNP